MRKVILSLLAFLVFVLGAAAQDRTINGKVTDEKGAPIEGVSVTLSNGKNATKTDNEGNYQIVLPSSAKSIVFTSVNYQSIVKAVGSSASQVNIKMRNSDKNLDEVVVTAFGIKKDKKTLGYGVTQLNTEELTQAHTTNITNALAGKVPGVRISGSGGSFTGSSIIIRGFTTFTGSNQPLFVIDGIPFDNSGGASPLQAGPSVSNRGIDISQDDIETMSVLKGPSAAALYGSRASNGVILITTKKGKFNQKNNVTFNLSYGLENVNRTPDFQNEYSQGLSGVYSATNQNSWGPRITGQTVTNAFGQPEVLKAYPNNVTDIFRGGENIQAGIGFSNGSEKHNFRFSYNYLANTGVIDNNKLIRHNFSINTSSKITNSLTTTISANYVNNSSIRTQQGNQLSNPLFRAWFTPRSYNLTGTAFEDLTGNQVFYNTNAEDNPYWSIKNNRFNDEINRFFGNIALNLKIAPWISFDYKIGADQYSTFNHAYDQIGAKGGANAAAGGVGAVLERRNNFLNLNSNAFFTVNKKFLDRKFAFTAIVGNEFNQRASNGTTIVGTGVVVRDFEQLSNTATYNPATGSTKDRLIGLYGDFTLGYKSIASINATLRNDWSSTFKREKNNYLYNAISGSINFTELIPKLRNKIISNIKVRGNIATVGKAGTDFVYSTDSYFAGAASADGFGPRIAFPFNGIQGFTLGNAAGNSNLGPEFTTNKEIAFEVGLFKNRLNVEATFYNQNSKDLIFSVPVSNASGITNIVKNAGKLYNRGIELSVNATPLQAKDFKWKVNFNYTQFLSIVDDLDVGVANIFLGGFTTPNIRLVKGEEYGQIYGNKYQRNVNGDILLNNTGFPLITSGVENIGNPNPKYLIGLTNSFEFKGFELSFLIDIKEGGDQYSRNIADLQRNGVAAETAEYPRYDAAGVVQKPYIFPGVFASNGLPNTVYLSAQEYYGNTGKYAAAEGFIYNTSWVRLREVALSYTLPKSILGKTPFGSAAFSVYGRNLFLNAPGYPHLDPEQNALGIGNAQGLEFNALPQTRSMGMSLKVSF